ncbi:MAG: hypothetical protein FJ308_12205 [Planctomycetes bacterium]|nr:hypothetical protein [Planctomycetota bacterium]
MVSCVWNKGVADVKGVMQQLVRILVLGSLGLLLQQLSLGEQTLQAQIPSISSVEIARGRMSEAPMQPQLAIDADDVIHATYGVGNRVYHIRSKDGGKSFSGPVDISFAKVMSLGMRRGPRITASEGTICITSIGGDVGKGRDGDILARCSRDGGKLWSDAVCVNDVEGSAREGLHAMASGSDGFVCCVWLDLWNQATELMASMSTDGGGIMVTESVGIQITERQHL